MGGRRFLIALMAVCSLLPLARSTFCNTALFDDIKGKKISKLNKLRKLNTCCKPLTLSLSASSKTPLADLIAIDELTLKELLRGKLCLLDLAFNSLTPTTCSCTTPCSCNKASKPCSSTILKPPCSTSVQSPCACDTPILSPPPPILGPSVCDTSNSILEPPILPALEPNSPPLEVILAPVPPPQPPLPPPVLLSISAKNLASNPLSPDLTSTSLTSLGISPNLLSALLARGFTTSQITALLSVGVTPAALLNLLSAYPTAGGLYTSGNPTTGELYPSGYPTSGGIYPSPCACSKPAPPLASILPPPCGCSK